MSHVLMLHLRALADLRAYLAAVTDALSQKRAQFNAENAEILGHAKTISDAVATAELQVRTLARLAYERTGEKAPAPGVEIKVAKAYSWEPAAALAWAQQTRMCLVPESLDEKAFTKIAKAAPLPFVRITEEPRAFIASQLNATDYLGASFADENAVDDRAHRANDAAEDREARELRDEEDAA